MQSPAAQTGSVCVGILAPAPANIHLRVVALIVGRSQCLVLLHQEQLAIQQNRLAVVRLATRLTFHQRRQPHQLPHRAILVDIEMKSMMMD